MKKQIIIGITVAACVALCATVWLRDAEVGNLPAMPVKATVSTEIEAQSEEIPHILLSGRPLRVHRRQAVPRSLSVPRIRIYPHGQAAFGHRLRP